MITPSTQNLSFSLPLLSSSLTSLPYHASLHLYPKIQDSCAQLVNLKPLQMALPDCSILMWLKDVI
jgi:hypothetical protein